MEKDRSYSLQDAFLSCLLKTRHSSDPIHLLMGGPSHSAQSSQMLRIHLGRYLTAWERISGRHPVFSFSLPATSAQLGLSRPSHSPSSSKQLHTHSLMHTPHPHPLPPLPHPSLSLPRQPRNYTAEPAVCL